VFSVEVAPGLCKEDPRPVEEKKLRESFEPVVEDDGEEKIYCIMQWFVMRSKKSYKCV
jgi:hypothetical protein